MEDNHNVETRQHRNKKRKLRKGRIFLLFLFSFILVVSAFAVYQYRSGLQLAKQSKELEAPIEEEVIEFEGDEKTETISNYLIIGIDTRGEEQSRSDTMMVLSWNRDTNSLKLVSFMRDIYADIPGYQSYKLNTAYYLGGVQLLKDTLNTMFDIPIQHYTIIDFKSFESLIDILAPNGVEIDVEKDMSAFIDVNLTQGVHQLDGKELLGYARFRYDANGDFGRVERQQKVIEALKDELLSPKNLPNLPKLVGATQGYITTDLTKKEEIKTVLSVVAGGDVEIEKMTIPTEGTYQIGHYQHAGEVLEIDVETNKQQLHNFLQLEEE
ncbi:LCP family protein [Lysinibacillus sp. BW-2-10]|uniref:LCP family protein n=1 Tax=Lysinibacillus sp. BW-2-10 TaxID=2590030 RepID=UPI00117C7C5A|nr:LCP family protein [Lysinibacillus sp. BW-2-10]TSI02639.1 LytR family transcriptional regulator [Lysinibacillus sp. BW-2-10]